MFDVYIKFSLICLLWKSSQDIEGSNLLGLSRTATVIRERFIVHGIIKQICNTGTSS